MRGIVEKENPKVVKVGDVKCIVQVRQKRILQVMRAEDVGPSPEPEGEAE